MGKIISNITIKEDAFTKITDKNEFFNPFNLEKVERKSPQEIRALVDKIKTLKTEELASFGRNEISDSYEQLEAEILDNKKSRDLDEVGVIIANTVKICTQKEYKAGGFFGKIFNTAVDYVSDLKRNYQSVLSQIGSLADNLEDRCVKSTESRKNLVMLFGDLYKEHGITQDYIEAFEIALKEAKEENVITENDTLEAMVLAHGKSFTIEQLEMQIDTLKISSELQKHLSKLALASIGASVRTEHKLKSILERNVTFWKQNALLYIHSLEERDNLKTIEAVIEGTNKMLVGTTQNIGENLKDVFKLSGKSIVGSDQIKKLGVLMDNNMKEINKIQEEQKRVRALNSAAISENKRIATNSRNRKINAIDVGAN